MQCAATSALFRGGDAGSVTRVFLFGDIGPTRSGRADIDLELLRRWDEAPHVVPSDPIDDWQWEVELPRSVRWREQLVQISQVKIR